VRGWLASPRRRRRLARVGLVGLVVAGAVTAAVVFRDSGQKYVYTGPVDTRPAQTVERDIPVPFTKQVRGEVLAVASRFVATAVERKKLDESWKLVHPELKRGYTLEQWRTGEIPVVPFPVDGAKWDLQYSFEDTVGLYVLLYPRKGQELLPTTFMLELKNVGDTAHHEWLVSSWVPSPGAAETAVAQRNGGGGMRLAIPDGGYGQGELDPLWLIVPVAGTFGLAISLVGFFILRSWHRSRRAMRAYARTTPLPPLPRPKRD
jgi:hypothetical protein